MGRPLSRLAHLLFQVLPRRTIPSRAARVTDEAIDSAAMLPPVFGVLFDGLAYGMLLFLLSVGLSVTLGMMNFINLAHCAFAMLGGYVAVTLVNACGWPFLATLPAGVPGRGCCGRGAGAHALPPALSGRRA